MSSSGVTVPGPFLSASVNIDKFAVGMYQTYLLSQSLEACMEFDRKIQEAIDNESNIDYIETLMKESDYYDSILGIALASTDYDENLQ
tara:strand:+ start:1081 stop:1344 length:264 start_codon:yes stop_codon:yes gene_type:complete